MVFGICYWIVDGFVGCVEYIVYVNLVVLCIDVNVEIDFCEDWFECVFEC